MKKFSTAALLITSVLTASPAALAETAAQTAPQAHCTLRADAPDQHQVQRGDTLWDIAGRFLARPWCWPQVWGHNKDRIRDPHWIYPGQIVYLDRTTGRLHLGTPHGSAALSSVRLSPHTRVEELPADAIPTIPAHAIEPFLLRPLVVEANGLDHAPRIVATQEGRVFLGKGDKAYVRGDLSTASLFQVYRPGVPLADPLTKEVLGHEAAFLGTVRLDRAATAPNQAHRFIVENAREEMGVGDRLVAMALTPMTNFQPHAPATPVAAQVMSIYGGVSQAGQNQVITLNRGRRDGLEPGSVLALVRKGQVIADRTDKHATVHLPDEPYGTVLVFRSFERLAYGLVMQVTDAVYIGDLAQSPE